MNSSIMVHIIPPLLTIAGDRVLELRLLSYCHFINNWLILSFHR